jgi:hypothetical protein
MKVMSIIGLVWFSLCLLLSIFLFVSDDVQASAKYGMTGILFAIPLAIVGLVESSKKNKTEINVTQELLKLHELKEKGVLTEDEFQTRKTNLLKI